MCANNLDICENSAFRKDVDKYPVYVRMVSIIERAHSCKVKKCFIDNFLSNTQK